jgi:uncharacterized protein (TIGR03084 family)
VADLPEPAWASPTPAEGWTIAHQIAHLHWTDRQSILAATDPGEFMNEVARFASSDDPLGYVDAGAEALIGEPPADLLATWREGRAVLIDALAQVPPGMKLPWFGPPMSVASMATARIMETWAHGQDIADTLGVGREPTARLRHVAHIGIRARDFAFFAHGIDAPGEEFRVELQGPNGEEWTWGPADAAQVVTGFALDFCLLVTQRRHRADCAVAALGDDADRWLDIAQAFAGPPGPGRAQGQFA